MRLTLFQDRNTGKALPDNMATTQYELWKPYRGDFVQRSAWRPLRNLIRRVRARCLGGGLNLTAFRPVESQVKDGCSFPDYFACDKWTHEKYVVIVIDPDVNEPVIYAYGSALE